MSLTVEILDSLPQPLAAELLVVQSKAYRVEAELIGFDGIPALAEDLTALRSASLTWLVAFRDGLPVGALGCVATAEAVDVDRLFVAPWEFRQGIASALLDCLLDLAGPRPVAVATGRANTPARSLYERAGFTPRGEREVAPGVAVVHYERRP